MKKTPFVLGLACLGILASCKKDSAPEALSNEITQEEKALVAAAGFNSNWAEKTADGNFLIEGDILLSKAQLDKMKGSAPTNNFIVAKEEHYRTYELVHTGSTVRTITISIGSGFPSYYSTGLDQSIAKYNSYNLNIRFQRVPSGGEIHISGANLGRSFGGGCILGQAAGFPSGGNPAPGFTLSTNKCATSYINNANKADEVIAHEIGHCIGFRHTDYINRASCGGGSGESAGTIGAVHIDGTPETVSGSYNSWMMACTNGDPSFSSSDGIALTTVYK
ncbi:MAG TPA: M57 family metalloprotease [Flavisolibacter sp.]|jgi:hypothetical protein|nr:M57 family metalloprotease [Flavisolibacter sp.]